MERTIRDQALYMPLPKREHRAKIWAQEGAPAESYSLLALFIYGAGKRTAPLTDPLVPEQNSVNSSLMQISLLLLGQVQVEGTARCLPPRESP